MIWPGIGQSPLSPAPRPCSPIAAVTVARSLVGTGVYQLGTGDHDTPIGGPSDCFGFAFCRCYGVPRHRPGFNAGAWATVSDDLNCNSAIEDADHQRELFVRADRPQPGDLIAYPTIRLAGHEAEWIGHIKIVVGVERCIEWDPEHPDWSLLDTVECMGPNGREPGIVAGNGYAMVLHDERWPKPEHRTALLRVVP